MGGPHEQDIRPPHSGALNRIQTLWGGQLGLSLSWILLHLIDSEHIWTVLKEKTNVFAWQHSDMSGVDLTLAQHCLCIKS